MCCLVFSAPARADDAWVKLGRGGADIAFCFLEVPYQIGMMGKTHRWPIAFIGGLGKGAFTGARRLAVGAFEVVTFPFPWPKDYGPILKPEFPIAVDADGEA